MDSLTLVSLNSSAFVDPLVSLINFLTALGGGLHPVFIALALKEELCGKTDQE